MEMKKVSSTKRPSASELIPPENDAFPKKPDIKTNWRAVYAAGVISFLSAVESTFVVMADWPYMKQIDPEATAQYYGLASSISTVGHVLFSILFSYWTYRSHTVKNQLIVGRCLAFFGCCVYLCVEFLSEGRRHLLLFCYVVFSVASSSAVILRVYLVLTSSEDDRTKAFSAVGVAGTISIVVGPLGQLAFSGITYPGISVFPKVHFNLYTAPVWMATLTNMFSIFFVKFVLPEMPPKPEKSGLEYDTKSEGSIAYSISALKQRCKQIKELDVHWPLVILCLGQRLILGLSSVTLDIIFAPLMMTLYGWDSEYMVFQSCIIMTVIGVLAIVVCAAYMGTDISKWIPARTSFLLSLLLCVFMYFSSYPWSTSITDPVPQFNATTGTGCNPQEYSWCATARATNPILLMTVMTAVMGVGLTVGALAIDTIYSKVLRSADQSIMQALVVVIEDLAAIIEPVYATGVFAAFGVPVLWICNSVVTGAGVLLWIFYFRKLKAYE